MQRQSGFIAVPHCRMNRFLTYFALVEMLIRPRPLRGFGPAPCVTLRVCSAFSTAHSDSS